LGTSVRRLVWLSIARLNAFFVVFPSARQFFPVTNWRILLIQYSNKYLWTYATQTKATNHKHLCAKTCAKTLTYRHLHKRACKPKKACVKTREQYWVIISIKGRISCVSFNYAVKFPDKQYFGNFSLKTKKFRILHKKIVWISYLTNKYVAFIIDTKTCRWRKSKKCKITNVQGRVECHPVCHPPTNPKFKEWIRHFMKRKQHTVKESLKYLDNILNK